MRTAYVNRKISLLLQSLILKTCSNKHKRYKHNNKELNNNIIIIRKKANKSFTNLQK